MSQPLAKVTGQLDAPRGPDVEFQIVVPQSWFGSSVEVELPRNLNCGHCQGGGCDRCDRAGALSLRDRDAAPEKIVVALPSKEALPSKATLHMKETLPVSDAFSSGQSVEPHEPATEVHLRIPGRGAPDTAGELGPGHLLLKVRAGADFSPCVRLVETKKVSSAEEERLQMIRRSVVMAVGLILLFIGLLRLSGWL